jgi:hypothetical protein
VSDKLKIPGPDEHNDFSEIDTTIVVGWAICMLICIALFLFFRDRRPEAEQAPPDDPVEARQLDLVERAGARAENFDRIEFGDKDAVAVFRHGPRAAAEAACETLSEPLAAGTLTHTVHLELLKTVDRRAEHAPWTCLLERYFTEDISTELDLHAEIDEFWGAMQRFEAPAAIVSSVIDDFRSTRERPEQAGFYSWLRLCALHPRYEAASACLALTRQLSPAQGVDALAMVEKHFKERDPQALVADMDVLVPGVGKLASQGQPDAWTVGQSSAIDDYDTSLRIGASFVLCRLAQSPRQEVASKAALQLAEVATVAARPTDENLLTRWRESCSLAFRNDADADADPEEEGGSKVLAVWNGEADNPPDYTLAWAEERGDCTPSESRPSWYCGVELWQGEDQALDLAMMGFFTETRYVEWD